MKWIEIDPNNLPTGEVLGACFKERTHSFGEKLVGYLKSATSFRGWMIVCESDTEELENVTHYIDIHEHYPEESN